MVVPLIACAEVLSWIAVLTRDDLFHALENSTWTVVAAFAVAFLASRWRYEGRPAEKSSSPPAERPPPTSPSCRLRRADVFMRWHAGHETVTFAQGLAEVLHPAPCSATGAMVAGRGVAHAVFHALRLVQPQPRPRPSLKAGAAAAGRP